MSYTNGPLKVEVWDYSHNGMEKKEMVLVSPEVKVATLTWDGGKNNPFSLPEAEARANGALFAASHDMLEALEDLVKEIKHRGLVKNVRKDFSMMNYMVQAEKAITKAKGGQI